jgi:hypothetical protein
MTQKKSEIKTTKAMQRRPGPRPDQASLSDIFTAITLS